MNYYTTTNGDSQFWERTANSNVYITTNAPETYCGIDEDSMDDIRKNLWQGWWNATAIFNEDGVVYINKDKKEAEFDCDFSKL